MYVGKFGIYVFGLIAFWTSSHSARACEIDEAMIPRRHKMIHNILSNHLSPPGRGDVIFRSVRILETEEQLLEEINAPDDNLKLEVGAAGRPLCDGRNTLFIDAIETHLAATREVFLGHAILPEFRVAFASRIPHVHNATITRVVAKNIPLPLMDIEGTLIEFNRILTVLGKVFFIANMPEPDFQERTAQWFQPVLKIAETLGFHVQYFVTPQWSGIILTKRP